MSNIKRQIEWATVQVEKDGKVREIDRGHIDVKARYQRIDNGNLTTADDPERGVWYGIEGCGFWTDDWLSLHALGEWRIPCCPYCGTPGFQTTRREWDEGVKRYTLDGHPDYPEVIAASFEKCKKSAQL